MGNDLSVDAQAIVDAGLEAGRDANPEDAYSAADEAVDQAIGRFAISISSGNVQRDHTVIIGVLKEIAKRHVRENLW